MVVNVYRVVCEGCVGVCVVVNVYRVVCEGCVGVCVACRVVCEGGGGGVWL